MASNELPPALLDAIAARRKGVEWVRKSRKRLTDKLGVNTNQPCRVDLPVQYLHELPTPYPPADTAIAENETIYQMWKCHRDKTKHPDTRRDKPPPRWPDLMMLDPDNLQYVVKASESVLFRDAADHSKIIGAVIRDFCPVEGVTKWVSSVIDKNVNERRNVRVRIIQIFQV